MKHILTGIATAAILFSSNAVLAGEPLSLAYIPQAVAMGGNTPTAFDFSTDFTTALTGFSSAAASLGALEPVNGSLALLSQEGDDNVGTFAQEGIGNVGLIQQIGNSNIASIMQSGGHQHAMILQSGNGNRAFISQR